MAGAEYKISKGDTIYSIAKKYGVSSSALMLVNKINDARKIQPGQTLTIPIIKNIQKDDSSAGLDTVDISKPSAVTTKPATKSKPLVSKDAASRTENTNYTTAQIKDKIKAEAKKQGIDENLALAVVEQESVFNPNAKSPTGAVGLFQLTKIAAKQVNGEKTVDVDKNIEYGTKYLKWCKDHTTTNEEALVAYNRGLGAMKKAKNAGTPIDSITDKKNGKGYAKNVLDIYEKIKKS